MRSPRVRERRKLSSMDLRGLQHSEVGEKKCKSQEKKISEKWLVRNKDNRIAERKPGLGWEWGRVRN